MSQMFGIPVVRNIKFQARKMMSDIDYDAIIEHEIADHSWEDLNTSEV